MIETFEFDKLSKNYNRAPWEGGICISYIYKHLKKILSSKENL